jgi:AcrR family transcriptional regulator
MLADHDELYTNETCRRLIDAASEEFARHGFSSARIRQIVVAAKVNLASVNYYFGGKEGLYRATLRHLAAQSNGAAHPAAGKVRSPEHRLQRRVHAILERFIGARPSPLGRILAHEAMAPTGNFESLFDGTTTPPELEQLRDLLRELERLRSASTAEK